MTTGMEYSEIDNNSAIPAQEQCWPSDILLRLSHFLSLDGSAVFTWHKLVYLVCKNAEWIKQAQSTERPLLLTIECGEDEESRKFKIPFYQATVVRIEIDWGDFCIEKVLDRRDGYASHEYKHPGVYHVKVFPSGDTGQSGNGVWLDHLGFRNVEDTSRWWQPLRSLDSLGTLGVTSLSFLFRRMKANIVDLSRLRTGKITDMSYMFSLSSFNQPIGHWNVSNVTNMSCMFQSASDFNQPIGAWNVSRVENMGSMFCLATDFNQPIGKWDVRNVKDMMAMFFMAESFNQPIGDWHVSHASDKARMFEGAESFCQQVPWHTK
jgi:surface protein